ncbi:MAG: hypothetical protein JKX97_02410, partial [Candidatus Lindowbacteria bacterium]|nr:hypothetical protein [Candidatus Lindowbacteria bacterium]
MIVLFVALSACGDGGLGQSTSPDAGRADSKELFSPKVEASLDVKADQIKNLIANELVVRAVRASNEKHKDITSEEIQVLDHRW